MTPASTGAGVGAAGAGSSPDRVDVLVVGAGQSGLAAGHALRDSGLTHAVLDAGAAAGGSWPDYYDSLELFSPASRSALPGLAFTGPRGRYPGRDDVRYLQGYARHFDLPVFPRHRVQGLRWDGASFTATLTLPPDNPSTAPEVGSDRNRDGVTAALSARALIAATGGFGTPHRPHLPGAETFTGRLLHVGDYRTPEPFAGQRVVVVGAGNSAVQVATELADVAHVSLATRRPVTFRPQHLLGIDLHHWLRWSGLDRAPLGRRAGNAVGVLDTGRYRAALHDGRPDQRPMFTEFTPTGVRWSDGRFEDVDAVILATGYRPDLGWLQDLPAVSIDGYPHHCRGLSTTVPRLAFVGLPGQRSFASATLRGVGSDARHVVRRLARDLNREHQREHQTDPDQHRNASGNGSSRTPRDPRASILRRLPRPAPPHEPRPVSCLLARTRGSVRTLPPSSASTSVQAHPQRHLLPSQRPVQPRPPTLESA